jgi:putative transposase
MRPPRVFHPINSSVINAHLISRALDRKMIFDDLAKEKFRQLLGRQLAFPTKGMAIGGKAFLEQIFERRREFFGPRRIDGARKIQEVRWGGLMALRELRL